MSKDNVEKLLKKFKKKSKRTLKKEIFTEFFFLNKNRKVIEFLLDESENLLLNNFFKELLPKEIKEFCELKLVSDDEEVKTWYYDDENLIIKIDILWGINKQEMFLELDIDNFTINNIKNESFLFKYVDVDLLRNYLINFVINVSKKISKDYNAIKKKYEE